MDTLKAREFYEQFLNALYVDQNVERLDEFCAPDLISHSVPPELPRGVAGLKVMARAWMDAFSDSRYTIETFIHDQGQVASRMTVSVVHSGPFLGIPATGRRVEVVSHPHLRIENGKIVEIWHSSDMLPLMHQLGALPAPARAA